MIRAADGSSAGPSSTSRAGSARTSPSRGCCRSPSIPGYAHEPAVLRLLHGRRRAVTSSGRPAQTRKRTIGSIAKSGPRVSDLDPAPAATPTTTAGRSASARTATCGSPRRRRRRLRFARNAQNIDSLLGKLLRIDPRANGGYTDPQRQPVREAGAGADEIYSYGLRNPYPILVRQARRRIAIGDVGQSPGRRSTTRTWQGGGGELRLGRIRGLPATRPLHLALLRRRHRYSDPGRGDVPDIVYPHDGQGGSREFSGCAVIGGTVVRTRG